MSNTHMRAVSDQELGQLRGATAQWVADVCAAFEADPPRVLRDVLTEVTPDGGYKTRAEPRLDVLSVERLARELNLPSFGPIAAFGIARRDLFPSIPMADSETGSQRVWAASAVGEPILGTYLRRAGRLHFDRALFDELFDQIEAELQSSSTPYTAVAAIDRLDLPDGEVEVLPGTRIRPRNDADLEEWLNRQMATRLPGYIGVDAVLEHPYRESRREQRGARESQELVARLIRAVQLHCDCDAHEVFVHFRQDATFYTSMGGTVTGPPRYGQRRGQLQASDVAGVGALYQRMVGSTNLAACDIALDRWDSLTAGGRPHGQIVDAWVGLESLLFRGDSVTSEITYRASLRLAALIGRSAVERKALLRSARAAYNGRSKVLHGADTSKLDLPALAMESRDFLRRALIGVLTDDRKFDPNGIEDLLLS